MASTLELQIAETRRIIADTSAALKRHRERVRVLQSEVNRLGLQGEKGEQLRKAFEDELRVEMDLVRQLDGLLSRETDRLWRLEEQLRSLRPPSGSGPRRA
jgi:hypothetical protein